MVFTALTLTASAQSYWLVERLFEIGFVSYLFTLTTRVMPFVLLCATFTFLYKFIPYTKVRLRDCILRFRGQLGPLCSRVFALCHRELFSAVVVYPMGDVY